MEGAIIFMTILGLGGAIVLIFLEAMLDNPIANIIRELRRK